MKSSRERLELDKILSLAAAYAVLDDGKARLTSFAPVRSRGEAETLLSMTEEAQYLLFDLGAGRVEYFAPAGDLLERAEKGAVLSCAELLHCGSILRAVRLLHDGIEALSDERIVLFRELALRLTFDRLLEEEIADKIVGEDAVADTASEKLFSLRREIRLMGERIRAKIAQYLSGDEKKYLQDGIVTMRGDRYVIPVKAEYRRSIRGFVHDKSQSGATVFIEPEEILEMNNELRSLCADEQEEVQRILKALSARVGKLRAALTQSMDVLAEADAFFARAEYAYSLKAVRPKLNDRGIVEIERGRHPLLDPKTAVPVSVEVGRKYRFLILSGANTGGKTVTLKMCGLFCLMAACGLFVPAASCDLSVAGVFCDVGDSQSIEENLSTFSSHIVNLKEIAEEAGEYSFVLIDEPGGGTDPEEGQAIARAVLSSLLARGCRGIVTTHYASLKEFAYATDGLENGRMEFDAEDLRPLYRLRMGEAGSSNALAICVRLGLPEQIVEDARGYLSDGARAFERTLRAAEESRVRAEEARAQADALREEWEKRLSSLERDEAAFARTKEKFLLSSKAEARRIVAARTARADELLGELEEIFKRETLTEGDLIRARTVRNAMERGGESEEEAPVRAEPVDAAALKAGERVFVGSMQAEGEVLSVHRGKAVAEVQVGSLRVQVKFSDLYRARGEKKQAQVQIKRDLSSPAQMRREINLIGMTTAEAAEELERFLDGAVLSNFSEVRIVHGMGTGKLRAAVHDILRKHKRVESFRLGKYGEGESGVTIAVLK